MFYFLLAMLHIFVCVALIFFILIQSNKGMGLSGAFGAMGAGDSVFGSSGGMNIMIKITIGLSIVFAVSTVALTVITPPMRTGGIIAAEAANRPQSTSDLIDQSQGAGAPDSIPVAPAEGEQAPAQQ